MKEVKMIIADIRGLTDYKSQLLPEITPMFRKRYHSIKLQKEADQVLVSGYLLRKYLDVSEDKQLTYNQHGKPFLCSGRAHFNLSHSGHYVSLAISECLIGVDIEKTMSYHQAAAHNVFDYDQIEELTKLTDLDKDKYYTKVWTEWEAILKLKGIGFDEGWKNEKSTSKVCFIQTFDLDDYIVSCATYEETHIKIERLSTY